MHVCIFVLLLISCKILAANPYIQKTGIPTSYLLEIVVLTPGGSSTCIPYSTTSLSKRSHSSIITSTLTQTVTKTTSNCVHTITISSIESVATMPKNSSTTSSINNSNAIIGSIVEDADKSISTNERHREKYCWATMTVTKVLSQSSIVPTLTFSNTSSSVLSTDIKLSVDNQSYQHTVTQTVTQRILSLQNVRLVRKYASEE